MVQTHAVNVYRRQDMRILRCRDTLVAGAKAKFALVRYNAAMRKAL